MNLKYYTIVKYCKLMDKEQKDTASNKKGLGQILPQGGMGMDDFVAEFEDPLPFNDFDEELPLPGMTSALDNPDFTDFKFDDIVQGLPSAPNMPSSLVDDSSHLETALLSPSDNVVNSQKSLESQPQEKMEKYKKVCLPQGQIKDKEPTLKKSPSENQQESLSKQKEDLQLITQSQILKSHSYKSQEKVAEEQDKISKSRKEVLPEERKGNQSALLQKQKLNPSDENLHEFGHSASNGSNNTKHLMKQYDTTNSKSQISHVASSNQIGGGSLYDNNSGSQISSLQNFMQVLQRQQESGACPRIVLADGTHFQINDDLGKEISNLISSNGKKPFESESAQNELNTGEMMNPMGARQPDTVFEELKQETGLALAPPKVKKSLADKLADQTQKLDFDLNCMDDPMMFDEPDFDMGCPAMNAEPQLPLFPGDAGLKAPDSLQFNPGKVQGLTGNLATDHIKIPSLPPLGPPPMQIQSSQMSLPVVIEELSAYNPSATSKNDSLKYSQTASSNVRSDENLKEIRLKQIQDELRKNQQVEKPNELSRGQSEQFMASSFQFRAPSSSTNNKFSSGGSGYRLPAVVQRESSYLEAPGGLMLNSSSIYNRSITNPASVIGTTCVQEQVQASGENQVSSHEPSEFNYFYGTHQKLAKGEIIQRFYERDCKYNQLRQEYDQIFRFLKNKYKVEQDAQLREMIKQMDHQMNSKLHLTFMFSLPLILEYQDQTYAEFPKIDYHRESQVVLRSLKSTNKNIRYKRMVGTYTNIQQILNEGTVALHFAGHGARNNEDVFFQLDKSVKEQGDFLIFENPEDSTPCFLSQTKLRRLIEESESEIQFVFIASCHSEKTAILFREAGAKHVICIRQDEPIMDLAQIYFTEQFYGNLFGQDTTICKAFYDAKSAVENHQEASVRAEAYKFIIIRDVDDYDQISQHQFLTEQLKKKKRHECWQIGPFDEGKLRDIGEEEGPLFKMGKNSVKVLFGRAKDQCEIIRCVNKSRLVSILGLPGIGKSSVAISVGLLLEERNRFKDGIIYISMTKKFEANYLTAELLKILKKSVSSEDLKALQQLQTDSLKRNEILNEQRAEQDEVPVEVSKGVLALEKVTALLRNREILIILDNIEDAQNQDEQQLKLILETVLESCTTVKFLTTQRSPLVSVGNIDETSWLLDYLSNKWSVELLLEKAGLMLEKEEHRREINDFLEKSVVRLGTQKDQPPSKHTDVRARLQRHPIIEKLNGHPLAISLIASMRKQDNTLLQIHQQMESKAFMGNLDNVSHPLFCLQFSVQASVNYMLEKNREAVKLFGLIGMMPGGLMQDALIELWDNSQWYVLIKELINSNLIKKKQMESLQGENHDSKANPASPVPAQAAKGEERVKEQSEQYSMLPFMNKFAESINQQHFDYQEMHLRTCSYFSDMVRDLYNRTDVEAHRSDQQAIRDKMALHQSNIWACLLRIQELNTKRQGSGSQSSALGGEGQNSAPQPLREALRGASSRKSGESPRRLERTRTNFGRNLSHSASSSASGRQLKAQAEHSRQEAKESQPAQVCKQDSQTLSFGPRQVQIDAVCEQSREEQMDPNKLFDLYESDSQFLMHEMGLKGKSYSMRSKRPPAGQQPPGAEALVLPKPKLLEELSESESQSRIYSFSTGGTKVEFGKSKRISQRKGLQKLQEVDQEGPHPRAHQVAPRFQGEHPGEESKGAGGQTELPMLKKTRSNSMTMLNLQIPRDSASKPPSPGPSSASKRVVTPSKLKPPSTSRAHGKATGRQTPLPERARPAREGGTPNFVKLNARRGSHAYGSGPGQPSQKSKEYAQEQSSQRGSKQSSAGKPSPECRADSGQSLPKYCQLIIYYSSLLILQQQFDLAIKVLSLYKTSTFETGARGQMALVHIKRLTAIAFFRSDQKHQETLKLINEAKELCRQNSFTLAEATCSIAKSLFLQSHTEQYIDRHDSELNTEEKLLLSSFSELQQAKECYQLCQHRYGQAECLTIENQLAKKILGPKNITSAVRDAERGNFEESKLLRRQHLQTSTKQKSTYIHRTQKGFISCYLEFDARFPPVSTSKPRALPAAKRRYPTIMKMIEDNNKSRQPTKSNSEPKKVPGKSMKTLAIPNEKSKGELRPKPKKMFQQKLFSPSLDFLQKNSQVILKMILDMGYQKFKSLGDTDEFQRKMITMLGITAANIEIFNRTTGTTVMIQYKLIQDAKFSLEQLWKIHKNEFEKGKFRFGAPVLSLRVVYTFKPSKVRSLSFDQEEQQRLPDTSLNASGTLETGLPSSGLSGLTKRRGRSIDSSSDNSLVYEMQSSQPQLKRDRTLKEIKRLPADVSDFQNNKAGFKRNFKENQDKGLMFLNMQFQKDPQEQSVMSFSEQSSEEFGGLAKRREAWIQKIEAPVQYDVDAAIQGDAEDSKNDQIKEKKSKHSGYQKKENTDTLSSISLEKLGADPEILQINQEIEEQEKQKELQKLKLKLNPAINAFKNLIKLPSSQGPSQSDADVSQSLNQRTDLERSINPQQSQEESKNETVTRQSQQSLYNGQPDNEVEDELVLKKAASINVFDNNSIFQVVERMKKSHDDSYVITGQSSKEYLQKVFDKTLRHIQEGKPKSEKSVPSSQSKPKSENIKALGDADKTSVVPSDESDDGWGSLMADNDEDAARQVIQHYVSTIEKAQNIKQGKVDQQEEVNIDRNPSPFSPSENNTQKESSSDEIIFDEDAINQEIDKELEERGITGKMETYELEKMLLYSMRTYEIEQKHKKKQERKELRAVAAIAEIEKQKEQEMDGYKLVKTRSQRKRKEKIQTPNKSEGTDIESESHSIGIMPQDQKLSNSAAKSSRFNNLSFPVLPARAYEEKKAQRKQTQPISKAKTLKKAIPIERDYFPSLAPVIKSSLPPPLNQPEDEETIQIDRQLLDPEQLGNINALYDMYRKETITAQKRNYRKQIVDYLQANNIRHSFVKADTSSDLNSLQTKSQDVPIVSKGQYSVQEEEKHEPQHQYQQTNYQRHISKVIKSSVRPPSKQFQVKVKQIQKNIKTEGFLQAIPDQVMEDDQESQESDSIQIANNTSSFADANQVYFSDEGDDSYESSLAMEYFKQASKKTKGGRTSATGGAKSSFGSNDIPMESPGVSKKSKIGKGLQSQKSFDPKESVVQKKEKTNKQAFKKLAQTKKNNPESFILQTSESPADLSTQSFSSNEKKIGSKGTGLLTSAKNFLMRPTQAVKKQIQPKSQLQQPTKQSQKVLPTTSQRQQAIQTYAKKEKQRAGLVGPKLQQKVGGQTLQNSSKLSLNKTGIEQSTLKQQNPSQVIVNDKIKITILKTDITLQDTDVIVCPGNIDLEYASGIAGQVLIKGGMQIHQETQQWVKKNGRVSPGTVAYSGAGLLPCKHIIHAVGPIWRQYTKQKSVALLKSCIDKALNLCRTNKLGEIKSISIPLISSGNYGGPQELCGKILLGTCVEWSQRPNTGKLESGKV